MTIFKVILGLFVEGFRIEAVLKQDELIEEEDVECRPEKVSNAVVDENVDVFLIRKTSQTMPG